MRLVLQSCPIKAAALGLFLAAGSVASAGDIFCGHNKCVDHTTGTRGGAALSGGGPVFLPIGGAAPTTTTLATVAVPTPVVEHNPLAAYHEAELAVIRAERAKAAAKAEFEAQKRILDRLASASPTDCANCQNKGITSTDVEALNKRLDALSTRLTNVEQLLVTHDNFLKDMVEKGVFPKNPNQAPPPAMPPGSAVPGGR